jgi:hypothetical protein
MSMEEERRGRLFVPPAFTMAASVCTVHLVYPGSRTELRSESQIEPERRGEEPILIDIPKRLEIAVSQTKQTTEAVSNRIKKDPSADAIGGRNRPPPRAPSIACKCCVQVLHAGGFGCIKSDSVEYPARLRAPRSEPSLLAGTFPLLFSPSLAASAPARGECSRHQSRFRRFRARAWMIECGYSLGAMM